MPLAAGQTLTHFEILGPLGAGGMGEVYRARDTRLEREVAIKVLPEHFADDEERLRRFEREAKTLASLSHTNLAHVYGIDQVGDTCFIAMELVPGEDLEARLRRGAPALDEAIDVCRQIAEGLEAAHEAGVVHRDLKPANVRVTPDGVVKILDFGLAKPVHPKASEGGTSTAEPDSFLVTEEGLVLGTPTYMSPEQARGKPVDKRTDVWAFGCVLYECLCGRRAFGGESLTDVLAAIVEREPDWSRRPPDVPPHVLRLLRRCLIKDPRTRLRDAGEARISLSGSFADEDVAPVTSRPGRWAAAFLAGAIVSALAGLGFRYLEAPDPEVERPARGHPLRLSVDQPVDATYPRVSPDGTRLLYGSDGSLWVRDLAQVEAERVPGTEGAERIGDAGTMTWSPDGQSIAFLREGVLETLRLGEPRAQRRCATPGQVVGCSWGDNGAFLLEVGGKSEGLFHLPPGGGELERLDWLDPETLTLPHRFNPSFLPGGDRFLITDSTGGEPWIHVASLSTRTSRPLVRSPNQARYVHPGWIAWVDEGRLLVQAFDLPTSSLSGSVHELVRDVDAFASTGQARFAFSTEGTLVYEPMERPSRLEWIDRQGRILGQAGDALPYARVSLHREGRWLAASVITPRDGMRDLWLVDLERGTAQTFTDQEGWEDTPAWSPDGKQVAFAADWNGPPNLYVKDVGGGAPREVVPFDNLANFAGSWSSDGAWLLYYRRDRATGRGDLWRVDVETLERRPLLETQADERFPRASPDGRWIAFTSDESGRREVYVGTFPDLRGTRRVSAEGGDQPRWRRDSSELYYLTSSRAIASAPITEVDGLPDPGAEVVVIQASEDLDQFELTPDATRFLVVRRNESQIRPVSQLIVGWEGLLE